MNISIIGTGNLAFHFSEIFMSNIDINLIEIFGRKKTLPKEFNNSINYCNCLTKLKEADFYIICVSDDYIKKISKKITTKRNNIVLHCSGSTKMDVLSDHLSHGVFYPIQTFSKEKKISFKEIPIAIESNSDGNLKKIRKLGLLLSDRVLMASSTQRLAIHVSAVFANNFTNYMRVIADEILKSNSIDTNILNPLTIETSEKLKFLNSKNAQTGPAIRNDIKTIKKHLHLLKDTDHFEIYETISKEITKLNNEL